MTRILSDEVLPPGMALLPQAAGRGARREKIFCGRGASAFDPRLFWRTAVCAARGLVGRERQVSIRLRVRGELLGD